MTSEVSQEVTTEESILPGRDVWQAQNGCQREGHPRGQIPGEVLLTDQQGEVAAQRTGQQEKAHGLAEALGQLLQGSLHVSQRAGCLSRTEPSTSPCIDLLVFPSNGAVGGGGQHLFRILQGVVLFPFVKRH